MYVSRWNLHISDPHALEIKEGRMGRRRVMSTYPSISEHQASRLIACIRNDKLHEIDAKFDVTDEDDTASIIEYADGRAHYTLLTPGVITTQEELFERAGISAEDWEVDKLDIKAWPAHQKGPDDTPIVIQLTAVRAILKPRKQAVVLRKLAEEMLAEFREAAPDPKPRTFKDTGDNLVVLQFPDVHFGKHRPEEEMAAFKDAVDYLISLSVNFGVKRWLIVAGNDATHIDNSQGTTTGGTQLEYHGTYIQNFRATFKAYQYMVEACLQYAPVDIVVVPGNHDENTSFCVGEVLWAYYSSNPDVACINDENLRKYYRFGIVLLGFTHGKWEKLADLPMIMAQERPLDWSQTIYREFFTGDKHHRRVSKPGLQSVNRSGELQEIQGVVVRISPALTPQDGWHTKKGYVSMPGAEAHVFSESRGKIGVFAHLPD